MNSAVAVAARRKIGAAPAIAGLLALLTLAFAGEVLSAPLRHDEQMFATMGILYGQGDLYRDLGYNHLPNLPVLLGTLLHLFDVARPVLAMRWLIVGGWLATIGLVGVLAWRASASVAVAGLCCLLLIVNPLLGGQAGTLVSNNFLPIPFALGGLLIVLTEFDRADIRPSRVALAGFLLAISIGLKANFIFLVPPFAAAAFLIPRRLDPGARMTKIVLPLLAGGIVGGLPTLAAWFADPAGFVDHVIGYHRGPHLAWALRSTEPLAISVRDRVLLAQTLWGSGSTLLLVMTILFLGVQLGLRGWRPAWPVLLVAGLVATGIMVSFVPRPSFPQYFTPPLPFAIILLALLAGAQTPAERQSTLPLLGVVAALALMLDGVRLIGGLPALAKPDEWTGNRVHAIAIQVADAARGRPVATLAPLYAVEGGASVYKALAAGPFVYRVADLMSPHERQFWRTVSPATLAAFLETNPPGAILVGTEGRLDDAFRAYATDRGYRLVPLVGGTTRYGALALYVPTSASMSLPAPTRPAISSIPSSPSR